MHILAEETGQDYHIVQINGRIVGAVTRKSDESWATTVRFVDGAETKATMPTLLSALVAVITCSCMTRDEFIRWEPRTTMMKHRANTGPPPTDEP